MTQKSCYIEWALNNQINAFFIDYKNACTIYLKKLKFFVRISSSKKNEVVKAIKKLNCETCLVKIT